MRYYEVAVTDPKTGEIFVPNVGGRPGFSRQDKAKFPWTYCSLNDGANVYTIAGTNPAAQCVEMDIATSYLHTPTQNGFLRINGIGLAETGQAVNLNGMNISVRGGMSRGLPLANPAQANLLVSGQVGACFGNWVGTSQTLDFTIISGGSSPSSNQSSGNPSTADTTPLPSTNAAPSNIIWQWKNGQPFADALVSTLSVAYPKYKVIGAVNPGLAWTSGSADTGFFATLTQFARYVHDLSLKVIGGAIPDRSKYPGVSINLLGGSLIVGDGTTITAPKQIQYVDMVGQPSWDGQNNTVQITCRLRGDILAGDYIKLPNVPGASQVGLGLVSAASQSQFFNVQPNAGGYANQKSGSVFTGTFAVRSVRHVGNSRQPDWLSWCTVIDCYLASAPGDATVDALPTLYAGSTTANFYLPR
ncbi:hypothetical protein AX768_13420 [Burkholderia sp. PAMC 28687]|uniref:hypothetical protein n=1 Tax=Burkholderia sp. PAMC 28687 TaxID=1795874 RepID=UPI00078653D5|nr:hypothetical protein [Burkholderia sp. PAMC 28687]AMM14949.1 hypothetical protein AX768_13420 [Burkholderia sp. PAMC 28687]